MPDNSFDIVSEVNMEEVRNAVGQADKEIQNRFDLKNSKSQLTLLEKEKKISLQSQDEYTIQAITDILRQKMIKRNVPIKNLSYGTITPAASSTVKQDITLQVGIPVEKAKDLVKHLKDAKLKVQASIQGEVVRVSGKDRDTLQQAIALIRGKDFGVELQFTNFRTN